MMIVRASLEPFIGAFWSSPLSVADPTHPPITLAEPKVINLLTDLKEERDVGAKASWVGVPMMKILVNFEQSLKKYPPIKAGTPDPYVPPK
jgi:hypothetical protein